MEKVEVFESDLLYNFVDADAAKPMKLTLLNLYHEFEFLWQAFYHILQSFRELTIQNSPKFMLL